MGFWSGIKHALNSTLGTADFQPLDKIIKSQKNLVADDASYYAIFTGSESVSLPGGSGNTTTYTDLPYKIKMKNKGSCRIKVKLQSGTSDRDAYFRVLVNGVLKETMISPTNSFVQRSADIIFNYGDIITFSIGGYRGSKPDYKDLKICGNVVDTTLIENIT